MADTSLAVLPLLGKDPAAVQKLTIALDEALAERTDVRILNLKSQPKRTQSSPEQVAAQCGAKAACLASYGKKVQATQVLFGVVSMTGGTLMIDFLLVASANASESQKSQVTFSSAEDAKQKMKVEIARVLGLDAVEMPALQAVMPAKKQSEIAADEQFPLEAPVAPHKRSRALLYGGIAAAALGVGGLVSGLYFGSESSRLGGSVTQETPQPQVLQLENDANRNALLANVLLPLGGGLLAIGAALIVLDTVFELRAKPTLTVSPTGASAGVVMPW
jgi:hypothetical protein